MGCTLPTFVPHIHTDMGAIMTDIQTGKTVRDWARMSGRDEQTVMTQLRRRGMKGMSLDSVLSDEQWTALYANKSVSNQKQKSNFSIIPQAEKRAVKEAPPAPVVDKESEIASFEWELWAINFLEMSLILIGLARLYEWPGLVLGAMCCLFLFKTQSLARHPKHMEAVKSALKVVLYMCIASGVLHLVTFWNALKINTKTFNDESEVVTDWWMLLLKVTSAILPAVFVAYISFNAVKTTAKIHLKNN